MLEAFIAKCIYVETPTAMRCWPLNANTLAIVLCVAFEQHAIDISQQLCMPLQQLMACNNMKPVSGANSRIALLTVTIYISYL